MAANGRCLTNCFSAAANPEDWQQAPRKPDRTAADLARLVQEDDWARDFLLTKALDAGMPGDRVAQLLQGEYAEAVDIPHFAKAVGGCIGVVPPAGESGEQSTRYYGERPLKVKVGLYSSQNKKSPHYKVFQSWT